METKEAPTTMYYMDGYGELTEWSQTKDGAPTSHDADELPETLAEGAPDGWSVFDGEVITLTEEQVASGDYIDPCIGRLEAGCQWWDGPLRPATAQEVSAFFELRSTPTWRPIETAPKDGTEVLLYIGGRCVVGFWEGAWVDEPHGTSFREPTHWMPPPVHPVGEALRPEEEERSSA